MTFLIWRLHRVHAIVSALVIVAVAALIVPSGIAIADSYHHAVMNCSVSHAGCGDIGGIVFGSNGVFTSLVQDLVMALPLVFGILWGAPPRGEARLPPCSRGGEDRTTRSTVPSNSSTSTSRALPRWPTPSLPWRWA